MVTNEVFKIRYIDDEHDTLISKYLSNLSEKKIHGDDIFNREIEYIEIPFDTENDNYVSLLNNPNVTNANFILIDSKLFEERISLNKHFSGEDFQIIMKKFLPFINVVVITQHNVAIKESKTISKFRASRSNKNYQKYYNDLLSPLISNAIENKKEYEGLFESLSKNDSIDSYIKEMISDSLSGTSISEPLTSNDISTIIEKFEEIKRVIESERL